LALGIGPFVVGPAVERKVGLSAMSALAINADKWFDANWGLQKGLYSELFQDSESMDEAIDGLAIKLSKSHQEATKKLKKVFWKGTEDWDELLSKRAKISGELILSEFSKSAIKKIQNK
jgi:methylglutaconyl-CoA hydratase